MSPEPYVGLCRLESWTPAPLRARTALLNCVPRNSIDPGRYIYVIVWASKCYTCPHEATSSDQSERQRGHQRKEERHTYKRLALMSHPGLATRRPRRLRHNGLRRACTCTHAHIHSDKRTHTYTHVHTRTHTYIHTQLDRKREDTARQWGTLKNRLFFIDVLNETMSKSSTCRVTTQSSHM